MSNQLTISSITGTTPFDVYVCDITNTYCYFVSGITTVVPSFVFTIPPPLNDVDALLLKIVDTTGCERFAYYSCDTNPEPLKQFQDLDLFYFQDIEIYRFQ
jgi:hypothetical protein